MSRSESEYCIFCKRKKGGYRPLIRKDSNYSTSEYSQTLTQRPELPLVQRSSLQVLPCVCAATLLLPLILRSYALHAPEPSCASCVRPWSSYSWNARGT